MEGKKKSIKYKKPVIFGNVFKDAQHFCSKKSFQRPAGYIRRSTALHQHFTGLVRSLRQNEEPCEYYHNITLELIPVRIHIPPLNSPSWLPHTVDSWGSVKFKCNIYVLRGFLLANLVYSRGIHVVSGSHVTVIMFASSLHTVLHLHLCRAFVQWRY